MAVLTAAPDDPRRRRATGGGPCCQDDERSRHVSHDAGGEAGSNDDGHVVEGQEVVDLGEPAGQL